MIEPDTQVFRSELTLKASTIYNFQHYHLLDLLDACMKSGHAFISLGTLNSSFTSNPIDIKKKNNTGECHIEVKYHLMLRREGPIGTGSSICNFILL